MTSSRLEVSGWVELSTLLIEEAPIAAPEPVSETSPEAEPPVRSAEQRVADALARLEADPDVWVATADDGRPWLVPLSFHWTGTVLLMATPRSTRTYRNLAAGGQARLALGHTRDVVVLEGETDLPDELPGHEADATAAASGVDPRSDPEAGYVRFRPRRVQAWRTVEELEQRTIMRDGEWTAGTAG